ncbi:MAG: magnesium/cobalt transporter CorA [Candidatus Brocadiaceae bacterium]|nr:magnesium/cobalt transporter CorA [Candidatus Brocadiaceae bacterium]
MARFSIRRSRKAGLPPGTPVHTGEKKVEKVRLSVIDYDEGHFEERAIESPEECFGLRDSKTVSWINLDGLHDVALIQQLGTHFGLHPLVIEDIVSTGQRPKQQDYEDYLYVVLSMLSYNRETRQVDAEQVSLILGERFVLSFQEREGDVFGIVRERIRSAKGRLRKAGADYLLYSLMDAIVDNYFVVCEELGESVEPLRDSMIEDPRPTALQDVHSLKSEVLFLRKVVWPLREVVSGLERTDSPLLTRPTRVYLRDVYDHTIQVIDTVETFRDTIGGMVELYLSSVSNHMNEVMKVLTIIATIFIPLSFIAGVYGMNFDHMPELHWTWGYFGALGIMAAVAGGMLLYFRKRGWI